MAKTVPMTITEKILAAHAGKKSVAPGELVDAKIDLALANDITGPLAIQAFNDIGAKKVFHRDRVALVPDHFTPAKDILSAENCKTLRDFSRAHHLTNFFEIGQVGLNMPFFRSRDWYFPETLSSVPTVTRARMALWGRSRQVWEARTWERHGHRKALV